MTTEHSESTVRRTRRARNKKTITSTRPTENTDGLAVTTVADIADTGVDVAGAALSDSSGVDLGDVVEAIVGGIGELFS